MSKKLTKTSSDTARAELLQHILPTQLLPGEDPQTFEALHDALYLNLMPGTPYERILAEQLVTLEWEALRHRRLRDSLLMAEFRDQSMEVLQNGEIGSSFIFQPTQSAKDIAFDLVSTNKNKRTKAMQALEAAQITPSEILAKAYKVLASSLELHERHIAEIEVRCPSKMLKFWVNNDNATSEKGKPGQRRKKHRAKVFRRTEPRLQECPQARLDRAASLRGCDQVVSTHSR